MRQIKFRGKRIDNGEWVYGYYSFNSLMNRHQIFEYSDRCYVYEVNPKTIGQFTCLKDKKCKDIYEGDIVKNGMSGNWIIQPLEEGAMSLLGISAQYKGSNYDISALNENVEVIGNIHDKKD